MKRFFTFIVFLSLISFVTIASPYAKTETFTREYTYQAGEADSKLSSRSIALEQVKRLLLEELGVFLSSRTEVRDFQLTKDEIVTYTAGTVATIIIEERWNGSEYYMKASIKADPDQVARSLKDIKNDQDSVAELQQSRNQASALLIEMERLKKELAEYKKASSDAGKARIAQVRKEYDQAAAELSLKEITDKGLAFARKKKFAEAIEQFDLAMKAYPKSLTPYGMRGEVYLTMKEPVMAIKDFNRVLAGKPNDPFALKNRGRALYQIKDYGGAISDLERASQLEKGDPRLTTDLGRAYHAGRRYEDAVKSFTRAIEIDPSYPQAYLNRSFSYQELKMKDKAQKDWETAERLNNAKLKKFYTTLEGIKKEYPETARLGDPKTNDRLEQQSQRPPLNSSRADKQLIKQIIDEGRQHYKEKRYGESIKSFSKAIEMDSSFSPAYVFRAFSYAALKMKEQAKEDLETAVRLGDPKAKKLLDKISGRQSQ